MPAGTCVDLCKCESLFLYSLLKVKTSLSYDVIRIYVHTWQGLKIK